VIRINPDSPNAIREALDSMGIALKKRWGQNFLVNRGARERILSALAADPKDLVWEIGPGLGAMTEALLSRGNRVVAFEIDRGLCRYLLEAFQGEKGFTLVQGDFLKTWKPAAESGLPDRILGNLPYRSASLMIASLVSGGLGARSMVFTVQKELAQRMAARPATKDFSSFTVLCRAGFEVIDRGDLKAGSFFPAPQVVSSVIELAPRAGGPAVRDWALLSDLARALFASRRKTLRNNLLASPLCRRYPAEAVLSALAREGIDPGMRAEELEPEIFVRIAQGLADL
jgi:16S rRNA (adenine1518-N6/adenine1519-N6)-dimethyltransferase